MVEKREMNLMAKLLMWPAFNLVVFPYKVLKEKIALGDWEKYHKTSKEQFLSDIANKCGKNVANIQKSYKFGRTLTLLEAVALFSGAALGETNVPDSSLIHEYTSTIYYRVKKGEHPNAELNNISRATGVSVEDIKRQNPILYVRKLRAGDILEITINADKPAEIINGLATDGLNGEFYNDREIAESGINGFYYIVDRHDTLFLNMPDAFGVNIIELMNANNMGNPTVAGGRVLQVLNSTIPLDQMKERFEKFGLCGTVIFPDGSKIELKVKNSSDNQLTEKNTEGIPMSVPSQEGYTATASFASSKPYYSFLHSGDKQISDDIQQKILTEVKADVTILEKLKNEGSIIINKEGKSYIVSHTNDGDGEDIFWIDIFETSAEYNKIENKSRTTGLYLTPHSRRGGTCI